MSEEVKRLCEQIIANDATISACDNRARKHRNLYATINAPVIARAYLALASQPQGAGLTEDRARSKRFSGSIVATLRMEAKATEELHPNDSEIDAMREAAHQIEYLESELGRLLAAQQWQPIETALKDGTSILLLIDGDESGDGTDQNYTTYAMEGFHSARAWRTQHHVTAVPTHWMPRPAPPGKAASPQETE